MRGQSLSRSGSMVVSGLRFSQSAGCHRAFSTSRPARSYADTLRNIAVGPESRVMVQGFTGKASTFHCKISIEMGTNIVGGVSPSKGGQTHLDKPVFGTVREAAKALRPRASCVFVPPLLAADAIIDAVEAEIPLIVSVAEGIPVKDQMKIMSALHGQSKSRLVGANSPGMVNPAGCRMGISPLIVAKPGCVGIAARSGTLSYEASWATRNLGQSYILGLGGDFYPGTRTAEALDFFMQDPGTEVIVLVGEVGGTMEEECVELLQTKHWAGDRPAKPLIGFLAGLSVPPGEIFGHSGAIWRDGIASTQQKKEAWQSAGIRVVDTIAAVGPAAEEELAKLRK